MAWDREYQTGFEFDTTLEFRQRKTINLTLSGNNPFSGSFSVDDDTPSGDFGFGFSESESVRLNFMLRYGDTDSSGEIIKIYYGSVGLVGYVEFDVNRVIRLVDDYNGDLLEVSGYTTGFGMDRAWISVGVHMRGGDDGYFNMYMDGQQIIDYNSPLQYDDSGPTNVPGFNAVHIVGGDFGGMGDFFVDDFYIDLSSSNESEEVPPSPRFFMLRPTSDGLVDQWSVEGESNGYEAIDESGDPDGETGYVYTGSTGQRSVFGCESLPTVNGYGVDAVIPTANARRGRADTSPELDFVIYDGVNDNQSGGHILGTDWRYYWERFTLDSDGDPWSVSEVNSTEYGFETGGSF